MSSPVPGKSTIRRVPRAVFRKSAGQGAASQVAAWVASLPRFGSKRTWVPLALPQTAGPPPPTAGLAAAGEEDQEAGEQ